MLVFNQLIRGIIGINTVLIKVKYQKTFLIEEKKAIFGAHDQVQTIGFAIESWYLLIRMTLIS